MHKLPYRALHQGSLLKAEPDDCGFWYGFTPENHRIDVRWEGPGEADIWGGWVSYLAGDKVGKFSSLADAEDAAVAVSKDLGEKEPETPSWAMRIWKRLLSNKEAVS
jgi:hypothetical protein